MAVYKKKLPSIKFFITLADDVTVESKKENIIKLLDDGANINERFANDSGNTPLHISVKKNEIEIVKLLLQHGANTNYRNNEGKTALDIAKELQSDIDVAIVHLLEEFEAKSQIVESNKENTAFDISIAKHNDPQLMYNKRIGTSGIKGHLYMSKLLSLVLVRASLNKRFDEFYLGTCLNGIGSFNDVCIKYIEDGKEGMVFLTVKDVNKVKLTMKDLWREDGDFSLYKYFESYLNIIEKLKTKNNADPLFVLKTETIKCTFGVYITADIDIKDKKLVSLDSLDETARDLICNGDCTKIYRYKYDEEDVALLTKKSLIEVMLCIGNKLIRCIVTGNCDTLFDDNCIMKYHVVLAQKVIKVSEITEDGYRIGTFRKEFFYNHDAVLHQLRLAVFTSFVGAIEIDKETVYKLIDNVCKNPTVVPISELMKYIIPYYDRQNNILIIKEEHFKDVTYKLSQVKVCCNVYNQALELTMNKTLESLSFKLPPTFGNVDITVHNIENREKMLTCFAEKLIKLITLRRNGNSQDYTQLVLNLSFMEFKQMFASAVGNLLILDKRDKFYKINTNEETLGENANTVLGILKSKITQLNEVTIFIPSPFFPKLTLDADEEAKSKVKHFFCSLQFYVCQLKEGKIEELTKKTIQNYCNTTKHERNSTVSNVQYNAVYAVIHNAVQKWVMMDGKSYYLEENREFIDRLLTEFYGKSLLNVISHMFVNSMRKYDIQFNKDVIDVFSSQLGSKTTLLITEVNILTGIKLTQCYHNLNKYAFVDLNDITYLSKVDCHTLIDELKSIKLRTLVIFYEDVTQAKTSIFLRLTEKSVTDNYILVTNEKSAQKLRLYIKSEMYATLKDTRNVLNDLTYISQEKILDKQFLFQGELVKFSTVLTPESKSIINAKILQKVIKNEIIEIGKILTNPYYEEIKPYYIQRRLHRIIPPKEASLKSFVATPTTHNGEIIKINTLDALKDTVVIEGAPGMGKSAFLTHLSIKTKQINPGIWIERINLLDQTKYLYNLQKSTTKINKIHALKFVCNAILSRNPIRYSIKPRPTVNFDLEINNGEVVLKNGDEIDCIVLCELEMFIHCYNQGNTILLFDGFDEICPHYKKEMTEILKCLIFTRNSSHTGPNVKQRMWITSRSYNNIRETLENEFGAAYSLKMFTKSEQGIFMNEYFKSNIIMRELTLDQFKNIDSFFDFMKEFVSHIPKNTGMKFYKLSTIFLQSLYFNAMVYFISEVNKPLSSDKKVFITKWAPIFESREKYFKYFNVDSNLYLFKQYHNMAKELENSTLVFTPLHIYIVMEYFINQIKITDANNLNNVTKKWDFEMSTMSFYKYFIEMKLEKIRFGMKNQMDLRNPDIRIIYKKELEEFMNEHKKLAFYATFKDDLNEMLTEKDIEEIRKIIQRMETGREKTGIVDSILSSGIPRFIHLSFQEYLAVEYMADLLKMHKCNQLKYWRFILSKIRDGFLDFLDRKMEFDDDVMYIITDIETKKMIFKDLTRKDNTTILDRAIDLGLKQVTKVLLRAMADAVNVHNFNDFFVFTYNIFNSLQEFKWYDVLCIILNRIREFNAHMLCLLNPGFLNKKSYCKMCNVHIISDFKWQWKRYKDMFQGKKKAVPKLRRNTI